MASNVLRPPFREVDGKIVEEPGHYAERAAAAEVFRQAIVKQLALTPRKELFIYIHGYHNDFNDAAFAMAEIWHFLGRVGVPIVYTSPADKAIGWSGKLFDSPRGRIGNLSYETLTDTGKTAMKYGNANLAIVNFTKVAENSNAALDGFGHSYFRNAPSVSSDLIIMLREDLDPGEPGPPRMALADF